MLDFLKQLFFGLLFAGVFIGLIVFMQYDNEQTELRKQEIVNQLLNEELHFVDLKTTYEGKYVQEKKTVVYYQNDQFIEMEITLQQYYELQEKYWDIISKKVDN